MPRRPGKKAAKIREYIAANPGASAAEVVAGLKAARVRVTAAHVYNVKAAAGKRPGRRKGAASNGVDVASLVKAKKMVDQLGGVEQARAAVNALAKLL